MQQNTGRPKSRKYKRQRLVEGEDKALNTRMVVRGQVDLTTGSYLQSNIVPMRLDEPGPAHVTNEAPDRLCGEIEDGPAADRSAHWDSTEHDAAYDREGINDTEMPIGTPPARQRRDQAFYMEEFVSRVDNLLQALLSREALVNDRCGRCSNRPGIWRCKECFQAQALCRCCLRETHMDHPFHRIERWTGTHFEPAYLWQVGVYIRLQHKDSSPCQYLQWQETNLETFQVIKDKDDETISGIPNDPFLGHTFNNERHADQGENADADRQFMNHMDHLYRNDNGSLDIPDLILEEDDDHGSIDPDSDVRNEELSSCADAAADISATYQSFSTPLTDGLNNPYVRIIHTNGVHHLALVKCSCSGDDGLLNDLMHAGFMPTSFKCVKTLFTLAVLDQFRYSNLEMKASAYQFFQMLRHITMPMSPASVVNFYHELRRLSRLWRWMKKLKWAGFGHKGADPMNVNPGELGIFCPACPQPGINLLDDWLMDENRWVYRRFFVADGNFKADHVKQKSAAPDLWLSDGGGMMTRRAEYKNFI
jgi:hypothetical protein